jgi:nucleoside 2-deoxyribosyltransferase
MPFSDLFDDVFYVGMVPAAAQVGLRCIRVDQLHHGSDSVEETRRQIDEASVILADVTNSQPDVLYELGYAHAVGKPTVQICSASVANLPFSIRNRDTVLYEPGRTHLLAPRLGRYLEYLLAKGEN